MMPKNAKRQKSKGIEQGISSSNYLQKLSHEYKQAEFVKCPVNIAGITYLDMRLYIKYLDLKAQNPDCGTFKIFHTKRSYQRDIKEMVERGWAMRDGNEIKLRAYQEVWRRLGIPQLRIKHINRYRYWKIPTENFLGERRKYLPELEEYIRKKMANRKLAQMRYALKEQGVKTYQATFSAFSASLLFGYKSPSSGSNLRKKYFEVIPMTKEEAKPYFNIKNGRYEDPPKKIAL